MENENKKPVQKLTSHKKVLIGLISGFLAIAVLPNVIFPFVKKYDNYVIEVEENRATSQFPTTYSDDFGTRIDNCVNDHAPFRSWFLKFHNMIDKALNKWFHGEQNGEFYDQACIGKDGWMFLTGESELEFYAHANLPTEEECQKILEKVNLVDKALKNLGKKFEIVICPNKSTIYPEYMPDGIRVNGTKNRSDVINEYLLTHGCTATFTYLKDDMLNHKKDAQLYYKTDTHWMPNGAYYGAQTMFSKVGKDLVPANFYETTFNKGDLCIMTNQPFVEEKAFAYEYRPEITANWQKDLEYQPINKELQPVKYERMTSTNPSGSNLFIVRDSFAENLRGIIEKEYTECTFVHTHNFRRQIVESDLFKNSDTVIFESIERAENILYENVSKEGGLLDELIYGLGIKQ